MPPDLQVSFRNVLEFAIGGGWGQEIPTEKESVRVRVIRGTDIPGVSALEVGDVPVRYEAPSKVEKRLLKSGDIVLEISGGSSAKGQPTGRTVFIDEPVLARLNGPAIPASFCRLVRIKRELVLPKFAYYWLQEMYASGRAFAYENQSTGISNFQFERFLDAEQLALPSLAKQEAVVSSLEALDARRLLLRQTNATLESIAQALFKSWFIDFDPVRAKAEGREPEGMDAATAAQFPAEFEESALGLIPKGWRMGTLESLCVQGGGTIQTGPFGSQLHASDYEEEGIPVVMPQDLEGRRVSTERVARVSPAHVERLARHKLRVGDVVFSRRGDVGRHAAVTEAEAGWLCGTGCLLVRPGSNWPWPAFVSQALATSEATDWLKRHAVGATMPNLNTGILGSLPLLLPSGDVLTAFEEVVGSLELRISANRAQVGHLVALRDTLLPRLISGKLRLPEAQEQDEESVA